MRRLIGAAIGISAWICATSSGAQTAPDIEPSFTYVVVNPNGQSATYIDGTKVYESNWTKLDYSALNRLVEGRTGKVRGGAEGPEPGPTPTPEPRPGGPCGDMDCPPKDPPTPKPPKCHGPFCPGGSPFLIREHYLYIYRNEWNAALPERFDVRSLPPTLRDP